MQVPPAKLREAEAVLQSSPLTSNELRGLVNLLRLLRSYNKDPFPNRQSVLIRILYLFLEVPGLLAKMHYMRVILANKLKESHLVDPTLVAACTHLLNQIKQHPDYIA
jgi:hypothetical protein